MMTDIGGDDSEWIDSEEACELVFGSVGGEPHRDSICDAGCHAIKTFIIKNDESKVRVHYDAIHLQDVETKSINGDVWEVSGRYPCDDPNPFLHWKVVLLAVGTTIDGVEHLIYEPSEVWTGKYLDQLFWKK